MSSFSAHWLALREPLDARARAVGLVRQLRQQMGAAHSRINIIDLGAGTGANLRYAAPLLAGAQDWLLVERDPQLLAAIPEQLRAWSPAAQGQFSTSGARFGVRSGSFDCEVQSLALDLALQLEHLPLRRDALLTASALLDLVSKDWLRALMRRAAPFQATVWFTLTYDGRIECDPPDADDREVRELVNRHQLGDKGFGPALGPAAADAAVDVLAELGYVSQCAASDWCVGAGHGALQYALVEGWFEAACQIAPDRILALHAWRSRRRAHIEAGRSTLRVGHVDMVARPG